MTAPMTLQKALVEVEALRLRCLETLLDRVRRRILRETSQLLTAAGSLRELTAQLRKKIARGADSSCNIEYICEQDEAHIQAVRKLIGE